MPSAPSSEKEVKKETKDFVRIFAFVFIAMVVLPLAYRLWFLSRPPEPGSNPSPAQLFEKAMDARAVRLLTKPVGKWTDAEAKSEPEIHAWLKEQGNEILPWEWTEEARQKDPKGYAKCWRRIWRARRSYCEDLLEQHQGALKRIEREIGILTTIHAHRTNQVARLRTLAATNAFPCKVTIEHLEKGRFWGWNRETEEVECPDSSALEELMRHAPDCDVSSCYASIIQLREDREEASAACQKYEGLRDHASELLEGLDSQDAKGKGFRDLGHELSRNLKAQGAVSRK